MKNKKILLFIIPFLILIVSPEFSYSQTRISMEYDNGVYLLPCIVNGVPMKFIYDTGASDVTISLIEAMYMIKNGYISEEDFIGFEYYKIANGDITEGAVIVLKTLQIGEIVLQNVRATIVNSLEAPLLLGQSALNRLGSIEFDYYKEQLIINGPAQSNSNTISRSYYPGTLSKPKTKPNEIYKFTGTYKYRANFVSPVTELSLRDGPSLNSRIIANFPKNVIIYVIDDSDKVFSRVHINGYNGYISKRFLRVIGK
jgi:clan AA aspartic protease (TIGR02281 family)